MYHIILDIRFDLQTGVPPTSPGISLHWKCPSMWTHVYCSQRDHSAWRMIPFTQSGGPPSSPCITPPQHDWKMKSSSFCNGAVSLVWLRRKFVYCPPPPSASALFTYVCEAETHVCSRIWGGGPRRINSSRKRHGEGSTVDFLCRYSHLQWDAISIATGLGNTVQNWYLRWWSLITPLLSCFLTAAFYGN